MKFIENPLKTALKHFKALNASWHANDCTKFEQQTSTHAELVDRKESGNYT